MISPKAGRRNRLTLNATLLLAVGAALLPFALLSIYQSLTVRETLHRMIGDRLVASASMTALEQRDPIMMARRILETIARDDRVRNMTPQCSAILKDRVEGRMPIVNFVRWDAGGALRCSAIAPTMGGVRAEAPWWNAAERSRHFVVSAPLYGRVVPRRILVAVQPVLGASGAWQGALTAAIDLSWIERSLVERRLSPRALVGIADASGNILTSSGPSALSAVNLRTSDRRAAVAKGRDGATWIYASAPLYDGQLFVFYAEPQSMAFSFSREQFRYSLLLPLIAMLLTCFALWLSIDRFVIRWLRRAGRRVRHLAEGDYREEPDDFRTAPVELQRLGQDLDDMARSVSGRDHALRSALAAKDAMAREVNHRVKNNLQMITSLVSLQASRLSDPEARRLMTQTRLRVGALALVQRLVYELDESERGAVDTARLFTELCTQIHSNYQSTQISTHCHSSLGVISGDQAVSAALIVVEAVTNAYRHGFPRDRTGRIDVTLVREGQDGLLSVSDDGIGAVGGEGAAGIGLDLMQALTAQLEGQLSVSETTGGGRTVSVRFPCAEVLASA